MTLRKLLLLFQDILISKYLDMVVFTTTRLVLLLAFKEIIQQERLILLGEFLGKVFMSHCKMRAFEGENFHVIC